MRSHSRAPPARLRSAAALAYDAIPDLPLAPQVGRAQESRFHPRGREDFLQPLLLVQTVRLANLVARYAEQLAVVELGRTVRRDVRRPDRAGHDRARAPRGGVAACSRRLVSLAAGDAAGRVPAQLLKEDIFLAPWLLFAPRRARPAAWRARRRAGRWRSGPWSVLRRRRNISASCCSIGLRGAADTRRSRTFDGIMPRSHGRAERRSSVFALINAPALLMPEIFLHGLNTEIVHTLSKPHHRLARLVFAFPAFHWTDDACGPGLGPALAAMTGLVRSDFVVVACWRSSRAGDPPGAGVRRALVFHA